MVTPAVETLTEQRCRDLVADRSKGMCEKCGDSRGLEKAHRLARSQGGLWLPSNILDLCHSCHRGNHASPSTAYEGGWHLKMGQTPSTEPALVFKSGWRDWALLHDDGTWTWVN